LARAGKKALIIEKEKYGAGERNRTSDRRFTKPLLCQLSYASLKKMIEGILTKVEVGD
jgi:hypothetical protein